jgi:membrane protein YqaA with SNARE-associated domain
VYREENTKAVEKLKNLPPEVVFPVQLKDKIYYDDRKKLLIFNGVMTKNEKEELLRLSGDNKYKKAIMGLFQRASYGRGLLPQVGRPTLVRRLMDWTLGWANTPYATLALFLLAIAEASFFPIPPDVLLIALGISIPTRAFWYAFVCSAGSVLGGCIGYAIGYGLFELVGRSIIGFYGLWEEFDYVSARLHENAFLAVAVAGFTPIPYKLFTIAAGVCKINFLTLVLASALSRSARFFAEGALIFFFGEKVRIFIEKYFNILSIVFVVLLILGYVALKFLAGG